MSDYCWPCSSMHCIHIIGSASQLRLEADLMRRELMSAQNVGYVGNMTGNGMHQGIDTMVALGSESITNRTNKKKLLLLRGPK